MGRIREELRVERERRVDIDEGVDQELDYLRK